MKTALDIASDSRRGRLNIGAGNTYIPDFLNIDIAEHAEISLDLDREKLPFADDWAGEVFTYHTIEHVKDYLAVLGEIHRVMKHGAHLYIGVPYVTSTLYNLVNPYHRHHFNEFSFDFFEPGKLLGSAAESGGVMFRKIFHRFHYFQEFAGKSEKRKAWCRRHLFNVVSRIDFGLTVIKAGHPPMPAGDDAGTCCLRRFDEILASRRPYR